MPLVGAGDLEVHVAQVVFHALDVGQDAVALAFLDQAHGHAGHRGLDRHAGVHQRQGRAADRGHRGGAVGGQHLRDQAQGVGELSIRRDDREQGALGQGAVPDLAAGLSRAAA